MDNFKFWVFVFIVLATGFSIGLIVGNTDKKVPGLITEPFSLIKMVSDDDVRYECVKGYTYTDDELRDYMNRLGYHYLSAHTFDFTTQDDETLEQVQEIWGMICM